MEPWKDPIVTIGLFGGSPDVQEPILATLKIRVGIGTIDKSWTKMFTLYRVPGDGECFFSSINYLMRKLDKSWRHRATALHQYEKTFVQFHLTTDTEMELISIQQRWNTEKARFQHKGQYADHEIMMATATILNIDIQTHRGIDTLLKVEGRTVRFTIDLLYQGAQTDLNRGNHYDPLIPKNKPQILTDLLTTFPRISKLLMVGKKNKIYASLSESPAFGTDSEVPSSSPSNPKAKLPPTSPSSLPPPL